MTCIAQRRSVGFAIPGTRANHETIDGSSFLATNETSLIGERNSLPWLRVSALAGSCAVFAISLFVPCYYTPVYLTIDRVSTPKPEYGIAVFLLGWIEVFEQGYSAWLANPIWLLSLVLILRREKRWLSMTSVVIGLLLSLSFLRYEFVLVDEAGHQGPIIEIGIGYWLWVLSFVLLLWAGSVADSHQPRKSPE